MQSGRPHPIGIKNDLFLCLIFIVGIENGVAHAFPFFQRKKAIELAPCSDLLQDAIDHGADRPAHAGEKARILAENTRKQGGA